MTLTVWALTQPYVLGKWGFKLWYQTLYSPKESKHHLLFFSLSLTPRFLSRGGLVIARRKLQKGKGKQVALVLAGFWTGECKGGKIWSWDYCVIMFYHWQSRWWLSPLPYAAKAVSNGVEWQSSSCQHKGCSSPCLPKQHNSFHTGAFTRRRDPSEGWGLMCFLNLELSQTSQENTLRKGKKQAIHVTHLLCLLFPLRNIPEDLSGVSSPVSPFEWHGL